MDSLKFVERNEKPQKPRKTFNRRKRKYLIAIGVMLFVEAPQVLGSWITLAEKIMPFLDYQCSSIIELVEEAKK